MVLLCWSAEVSYVGGSLDVGQLGCEFEERGERDC